MIWRQPSRGFFALTLALACAATAAATVADRPKVAYTSYDQGFAKLITLQKSDLQKAWKQVPIKPGTDGDTCGGMKDTSFVLVGNQSTDFEDQTDQLEDDVWIMQTPDMVAADARQQPSAKVQEDCLRASYGTPKGYTIPSVTPIPFPHLGSYHDAFRVILDYPADKTGPEVKLIDDYIDVFEGRVELSLFVRGYYTQRNAVHSFEVDLAKLLVARATPPTILGFAVKAGQDPVAGKSFTFGGMTLKPSRFAGLPNTGPVSVELSPDTMTCTATLGDQPLAGTGKGGCTYALPAGASGNTLVVTADVTLFGAEKTFQIPYTVG
jgi:hypothetical protein